MTKLKKIMPVDEERDEITDDEMRSRMSQFFAELEERIKKVPESEVKKGAQKIKDFVDGKVSWADLLNFTPIMLYQMAEHGFAQFQIGRYEDAERIFKVLTFLDWNNSYYHGMMGAILQRERRYGEAAAEYSVAIDLDPNDIASYTNRGEILLRFGILDEARADLEKAISLDHDETDRWGARARKLLKKLDEKGSH